MRLLAQTSINLLRSPTPNCSVTSIFVYLFIGGGAHIATPWGHFCTKYLAVKALARTPTLTFGLLLWSSVPARTSGCMCVGWRVRTEMTMDVTVYTHEPNQEPHSVTLVMLLDVFTSLSKQKWSFGKVILPSLELMGRIDSTDVYR